MMSSAMMTMTCDYNGTLMQHSRHFCLNITSWDVVQVVNSDSQLNWFPYILYISIYFVQLAVIFLARTLKKRRMAAWRGEKQPRLVLKIALKIFKFLPMMNQGKMLPKTCQHQLVFGFSASYIYSLYSYILRDIFFKQHCYLHGAEHKVNKSLTLVFLFVFSQLAKKVALIFAHFLSHFGIDLFEV